MSVCSLRVGFLGLAIAALAGAGWSAPPAGYYERFENLTGSVLRTELRAKIVPHTRVTYDAAYDHLEYIDEDPNNTANILTIYGSESILKTKRSQSTTGYWNREHCWPQSLGADSGTGPNTDMHHLMAEEMTLNSSRNNSVFNYVSNPTNSRFGCKWTGTQFEAADNVKGNVARAMFYMELVYGASHNFTLVDSTSPSYAQMGVKSTLIEWHKADAPDERDARRCDRVAERQGNRNPYSDRPDFVGRLYNLNIAPAAATVAVAVTDKSPATLTFSTTNNLMMGVTATMSSGAEWQLGSLTLKASGTLATDQVPAVKLYADVNRDGAWTSEDVLLTQGTFSGDTVVLNAPGSALATSAYALPLLVTVDLAATAPKDKTFALVAVANGMTGDPAKPPHAAPTYAQVATKAVPVNGTVVEPPIDPPIDPPVDDTATSVVINKFFNKGTADEDRVELLVVRENLSLVGVWVKDFGSSGANDSGGGFQFKDVPKWKNLKAGTLIVLVDNVAAPTEATNVLCANLCDTALFTNGGGGFDIATNEIVMIKTGTKAGVEGNIHAVGTVVATAAQWVAITHGIKQRTALSSGTGVTVYVQNSTSKVTDFGTDSELRTATTTAPAFGTANSSTNQVFVNVLLPATISWFELE